MRLKWCVLDDRIYVLRIEDRKAAKHTGSRVSSTHTALEAESSDGITQGDCMEAQKDKT